jgi:dTMP kinase
MSCQSEMSPPHAHLRPVPGGLLVAFEGTDGAGKTTQAFLARDALAALGYDALYLREPTDGPIGQKLRAVMVAGRDSITPMEEFGLFRDDREENVRLRVRPAMERGAIVIIDRYYISSMAYQGALGLDPEFIRVENEKIAPRPDLTLLFRVPVDVGIQRIRASRASGQNLFELQHYQERVHAIFEAMDFPGMVRCDACQPVEQLHAVVMSEIARAIEQKMAPGA